MLALYLYAAISALQVGLAVAYAVVGWPRNGLRLVAQQDRLSRASTSREALLNWHSLRVLQRSELFHAARAQILWHLPQAAGRGKTKASVRSWRTAGMEPQRSLSLHGVQVLCGRSRQ